MGLRTVARKGFLENVCITVQKTGYYQTVLRENGMSVDEFKSEMNKFGFCCTNIGMEVTAFDLNILTDRLVTFAGRIGTLDTNKLPKRIGSFLITSTMKKRGYTASGVDNLVHYTLED